MKVHLLDIESTYINTPSWLKKEMEEQGVKHTACGYLRKKTTVFYNKVTCRLCQREMK